jgi:hypothetical protein
MRCVDFFRAVAAQVVGPHRIEGDQENIRFRDRGRRLDRGDGTNVAEADPCDDYR